MSVQPGITTTEFWNRGAQLSMGLSVGVTPMTVAENSPTGYGMTADGFCIPCATTGVDSLCSTPGSTGATNPIVKCEYNQLHNCQHASLNDCYGNATKAGLVTSMEAKPFDAVMKISFVQPTYGTAFQTMMAGQL